MLEGKTLKTKSFAHLKCTDGFLIRLFFFKDGEGLMTSVFLRWGRGDVHP